MTDIHIPPEAVEAAYAAWWKSIKSGAMTERALNVAILAALRAWPGMALRYRPSQSLDPQELILPLAAGGAR